MRTIKFRAKIKSVPDKKILGPQAEGEWAYGEIHLCAMTPHIHVGMEYIYPIDTDTVGQFTGLLDKNGKLIYEGDILSVGYLGDSTEKIEVRFVRGVFAFLWNGNLDNECPTGAPTHEWAEVIGNIHDNPDLIQGNNSY